MNPLNSLAKREQARRLRDQAELAMWGFMPDEAYEHAEAALRLDPSDASARLMQARVQLQRCRPGEAMRSLDARDQFGTASLAGGDKPLEAMLLRAASLAQSGQVSLAIAALETVIEEAPADLSLLRALGALQLRDARDAEAIETFTLIADLDPEDALSARVLSDLLSDYAPSQSVEVLRGVKTSEGLRVARRCAAAGRLLEAESRYAELLETFDQEGWLWLESASLSMRMGELTRAEERLMNAITNSEGRGPLAREAWEKLATQAMRRGRVAQAGRAWWRAIRAEASPYPEGWAGLLTCAMLAEREGLMRRVDRTLRGLTTRSQRRSLLAKCWLDTVPMRFADAAAKAAGSGSEMSSRLRLTGEGSPLSGLLAHAAETLQVQSGKFPGRADVRYHRAVVHEAFGDADAALDEAGVALSINPRYVAAADLCERLAA